MMFRALCDYFDWWRLEYYGLFEEGPYRPLDDHPAHPTASKMTTPTDRLLPKGHAQLLEACDKGQRGGKQETFLRNHLQFERCRRELVLGPAKEERRMLAKMCRLQEWFHGSRPERWPALGFNAEEQQLHYVRLAWLRQWYQEGVSHITGTLNAVSMAYLQTQHNQKEPPDDTDAVARRVAGTDDIGGERAVGEASREGAAADPDAV